jgi:DHA1 family tetracycline resistance protein-like MFS transporter
MQIAKKFSLYSLVFTIFNDALGWGIVLTIFAPLLLDPHNYFLPLDVTAQSRNILLGMLIASYPLTQFLFLPIVGAISDRQGRKKVLEWTILCAALTFGVSALAIAWKNISLLFISRLLAGVFSANAATAQAAIADLSTEKEKAKNLALGAMAGGIAWVLGPPIGGVLSSTTYFSHANFATPFWILSLLLLLNYAWVLWGFKETLVKHSKERHDWKQEIKDLFVLAKIKTMPIWLLIAALFDLGWNFYLLFYPALLVQRFYFGQSAIGLLSGYLAIFWLISSTALNKGLANYLTPKNFILASLPILGISSIFLAFAPSLAWWYVLFPIIGICGAAVWINMLALLSNLAGSTNQGKVFGIAQSLLSLASFISPLLSGPLAAFDERIPLVVGGVMLLGTGAFVLMRHFAQKE